MHMNFLTDDIDFAMITNFFNMSLQKYFNIEKGRIFNAI